MSVPKFLKFLVPLLLFVLLYRFLIGSGSISLIAILSELQKMDFGSLFDLLEFDYISEYFNGSVVWWDDSLSGLGGLMMNLKNVFSTLFNFLVNFSTMLFESIGTTFDFIVSMFSSVVAIFRALFFS